MKGIKYYKYRGAIVGRRSDERNEKEEDEKVGV
jgi:hypothetical protein